MASDEIYSYDEVPYKSWPYAQSHPDRLAVVATLFGMEPAPIDAARVLELGCAGGGNLLPMAETFPDSFFTGVDLSLRELSEAREVVDRLDLKNVELIHANIAELGDDLGEFDYVIAHGIFSWVSHNVQEKILTICRDHLRPNGIAYISYNTFPGWRMRGTIRDMIGYHATQFNNPTECVSQARALLSFLAESAEAEKNAYGAFLNEELQIFNRAEDHYLYHEHLEDVNEPMYFYQFVERAEAHGLQYLGEAQFSDMMPDRFSSETTATLHRVTKDIIQMEQYMDFLRNRTFRHTLLCHSKHALERKLDPQKVGALYIAGNLQPESPDADFQNTEPVRFFVGDTKLTTADPMAKTALRCLARAWPKSISFRELLNMARAEVNPEPVQDAKRYAEDAHRMGEHVLQCYAGDAIELHADPGRFVTEASDRPTVSRLVRLQAEERTVVTNRKHGSVQLNDIGRHVIKCLDGKHDRELILNKLVALVQDETLSVHADGEPVTDAAEAKGILQTSLEKTLKEFAHCALLIE